MLIKILLFVIISSFTLANENKIGSITEVNGTIIAITDELEERDLLIHDPVFLSEEIFVNKLNCYWLKGLCLTLPNKLNNEWWLSEIDYK